MPNIDIGYSKDKRRILYDAVNAGEAKIGDLSEKGLSDLFQYTYDQRLVPEEKFTAKSWQYITPRPVKEIAKIDLPEPKPSKTALEKWNEQSWLKRKFSIVPPEVVYEQNIKRAQSPSGAFLGGLLDTLSLGTTELGAKIQSQIDPMKTFEKTIEAQKQRPGLYTAGQVAGYVLPTAATAKLAQPLVKVATRNISNTLGKQIIKNAIEGGIVTGAEDIFRQKKPEELGRDLAITTLIGAGMDIGLNSLGKVIKPLITKAVQKFGRTAPEIQNVIEAVNQIETKATDQLQRQDIEDYMDYIGYLEEIYQADPKYIQRESELLGKKYPAIGKFITATQDIETLPTIQSKDNIALQTIAKSGIDNITGAPAIQTDIKPIATSQPIKSTTGTPIKVSPIADNATLLSKDYKNIVDENELLTDIKKLQTLKENTTNKDDIFKIDLQLFSAQEQLARQQANTRKLYTSMQESEFIAPETKQRLETSDKITYEPITNQETWQNARDTVKQDFQNTLTEITSKKEFTTAEDVAKGFALIDELQNQKNYQGAADLAEQMMEKATKLGQAVQAHAIVGRLSPEGVLTFAEKQFKKANKYLPENKKVKFYPDLTQDLVDTAKLIQQLPDGRNKELLKAQLMKKITDQIPVSIWKKLSTFQAMSYLLNARTALRNILGNTAFNLADTISNAYAVPFDWVLSKGTGKRTVTTPNVLEQLKGMRRGAAEAAQEVKLGVNLSADNKFNMQPTQVFDPQGNVLERLLSKGEKALSYSLRVPDEAFKRGIYQDVLKQQMKAAGASKPTEEMIKQAEQEALYRTFQDDSLPAQLLQSLKDTLNKVGLGKQYRGKTGVNTREFGLGDFVVKFTTVPGNIISRSLEYTPLGLLKAVNLLAQGAKQGKINQRDMALTLGRTVNGSTMIAMGVLLNRLGLLKSQDKKADKDIKAMQRAEGLGNYKLNLSGLERFLSTGDATQIKLQKGDILTSYNWSAPVSTAFAIGATLDEQLKKAGVKTGVAWDAAAAAMDEILDLPTLTVISQMFWESQKKDANVFDIASVPLLEAAPGFVPSFIRQISQGLDPIARQTKTESKGGTVLNKILANIPGQREQLPAQIGSTGRPIEYPSGALGLFSSTISPGNITEYQPMGYTDKLNQIQQYTGSAAIFPESKPPNSFTYKKQKFALTDADKTEWQQVYGQTVDQLYTQIFNQIDTNNLNEQSAKRIEKLILQAKERARETALQNYLQRNLGGGK